MSQQGFKKEKEARIIIAGANQKGYVISCELLYRNFCERNQFLFCIKVIKVFCTDASRRAFYSLRRWLYNREYRSPVIHFTQMYSDCVNSARNAKDRDVTARANPTFV